MNESETHEWVKRYARLKRRKDEIENEINQLRDRIIDYCDSQELDGFASGRYRVRLVRQERKDYDDRKLYDALPDPDVWRMVSRTDAGKVASLLKLGVLKPEMLAETYTAKTITLLQVEKK